MIVSINYVDMLLKHVSMYFKGNALPLMDSSRKSAISSVLLEMVFVANTNSPGDSLNET